MSDEASLISQFREVTGVDQQRAQFYLESAGWEIDVIRNLNGYNDILF